MKEYLPIYNKDTNYNTNVKSYYDYLAKVNEYLKVIASRVDEYDKVLADKITEINDRLDYYMEEWDKNLEQFPENVESLLADWLQDGTLDDIINENIFNDLNNQIRNVIDDLSSLESYLDEEVNTLKSDVQQSIDDMETRVYDEMQDVSDEVKKVDDNLKDHESQQEKHRSIYITDTHPDPALINNNDIFLSTANHEGGSRVLLSEVSLDGVIGTGTSMYISPEYRGKILRYELEVYAGIIKPDDQPNKFLTVLINGDNEENYRSSYVSFMPNSEDVPFMQNNREATSFPLTAVVGRYMSHAKIDFSPRELGETDYITWYSNGWSNEGINTNGHMFLGGGRWEGEKQETRSIVVRSNNSSDEWIGSSFARLWGVM